MPGAIKHMRAVGLFRGAAPSIDICGVGHFPLHDGDHAVVNVNNIYIPKPSTFFVKRAASRSPKIILGCPKDHPEDQRAEPAADRTAFRPPGLSRQDGDRSESRARADRSALRLPGDLPPTSVACGAPHRPVRTATPRRATSTRYAVPSSSPVAAASLPAP